MKKLLFTVVTVLCFMSTQAQEVRFGAKAGLNLANVTGEQNTKIKAGLLAGVLAEIKFSDQLALQPEIVYSSQGAKSDNSDSTLRLNYLNIPLMAKFYPMERLSLQAGPQIGFLMGAKAKTPFSTTDVKDNYKSVDFSLNLGLGYDFTENIFADARYNIGLSNFNDVKTNTEKYRNSVIQFSVGYKF